MPDKLDLSWRSHYWPVSFNPTYYISAKIVCPNRNKPLRFALYPASVVLLKYPESLAVN